MSTTNNFPNYSGARPKTKKPQVKYSKPTQQLYRPPSARVESCESADSLHSSNASIQSSYSNDSRFQHEFSASFGNVPTCSFPIKGVLKRSKSFGTNNNRNSGEFGSSSLLDESSNGRFLLSLEGLSWDNLTLIKQALDRGTCASLSMTQLLEIIRILCNKVLENPANAKLIAQVCMEIHQKQQQEMTSLGDHKYLFLESLANCLREWFNERDKLRYTTGGARRWTGYILFLMEMYLNLKTLDFSSMRQQPDFSYQSNDSSDDSDDNCSNVDNASNNSADEEVSRAFSSEATSDPEESKTETSHLRRRPSLDIETKIINSVLSKHQRQFANLLLDSFHVILQNSSATPAEIECMQLAFRKCGAYLEADNRNRIKALIFSIRDTLLNASQFITATNSSNNSSITKNLLEIIEFAASDWKFSQSQQIYYFPYTSMD